MTHCFPDKHAGRKFLLMFDSLTITLTRLTIEAETVLDGGVGGRRRRRERQGQGLQGGAHDADQERSGLRPGYVI